MKWMTWFRMFRFDDGLAFSEGRELPPRNAIIGPYEAEALSRGTKPEWMEV